MRVLVLFKCEDSPRQIWGICSSFHRQGVQTLSEIGHMRWPAPALGPPPCKWERLHPAFKWKRSKERRKKLLTFIYILLLYIWPQLAWIKVAVRLPGPRHCGELRLIEGQHCWVCLLWWELIRKLGSLETEWPTGILQDPEREGGSGQRGCQRHQNFSMHGDIFAFFFLAETSF